MRQNSHSETAEAMAAIRATISSSRGPDRVIDDPYAEQFLVGRYRLVRPLARHLPFLVRGFVERANPGAFCYVGVRHRVFDDAVSAAIDAGVEMVVILGAGFDSRSLRLSSSHARFVEIDHPLTQEVKRRIVSRHGWQRGAVDYAAIDLERTPLPAVLGEIAAAPALVVWEGVAWYLSEPAVRDTLSALAAWAAPGSRIIFDAIDVDVADGRRRDRIARVHRDYCARRGEPIQWGIEPARISEFMGECGWPHTVSERVTDAARRLLDPRSTLGEPMPFFSLIEATTAAAR